MSEGEIRLYDMTLMSALSDVDTDDKAKYRAEFGRRIAQTGIGNIFLGKLDTDQEDTLNAYRQLRSKDANFYVHVSDTDQCKAAMDAGVRNISCDRWTVQGKKAMQRFLSGNYEHLVPFVTEVKNMVRGEEINVLPIVKAAFGYEKPEDTASCFLSHSVVNAGAITTWSPEPVSCKDPCVDLVILEDTYGLGDMFEVEERVDCALNDYTGDTPRIGLAFRQTKPNKAKANMTAALLGGVRDFAVSTEPVLFGTGVNSEEAFRFLEDNGYSTGVDPERIGYLTREFSDFIGRKR